MRPSRSKWLESLKSNIPKQRERISVPPPAPPELPNEQANPNQLVENWMRGAQSPEAESVCPAIDEEGFKEFKSTLSEAGHLTPQSSSNVARKTEPPDSNNNCFDANELNTHTLRSQIICSNVRTPRKTKLKANRPSYNTNSLKYTHISAKKAASPCSFGSPSAKKVLAANILDQPEAADCENNTVKSSPRRKAASRVPFTERQIYGQHKVSNKNTSSQNKLQASPKVFRSPASKKFLTTNHYDKPQPLAKENSNARSPRRKLSFPVTPGSGNREKNSTSSLESHMNSQLTDPGLGGGENAQSFSIDTEVLGTPLPGNDDLASSESSNECAEMKDCSTPNSELATRIPTPSPRIHIQASLRDGESIAKSLTTKLDNLSLEVNVPGVSPKAPKPAPRFTDKPLASPRTPLLKDSEIPIPSPRSIKGTSKPTPSPRSLQHKETPTPSPRTSYIPPNAAESRKGQLSIPSPKSRNVLNEETNTEDSDGFVDLEDYNNNLAEGSRNAEPLTFVDEHNEEINIINIDDELTANLELPFSEMNNNYEGNIEPDSEKENNGSILEAINDEEITIPEKLNSRKKIKSKSKQQIIKELRNKGLPHVNLKGKAKEAKKIGKPCENCRFKCSSKVSEQDRQGIFSSFWAMGDHTRQQDYIKDHILRRDPAQHFTEEKQKQNSIKYFFVIDGKMVFVCKNMFLQTFNISERWVRTILKKLKEGNGHIISPDLRGRHPKVAPHIYKKNTENVEEHIKLFRTVPSHFCRAKSQRKYLPTNLSVSKMYRLYKAWMPRAKPDDVVKSEKFYRFVFNTKFNLGFHRPKKDRCDMCSVFDLCNAAQKAKLQEKYDMHIKHKNDAKVARQADKEYAAANKETVCYAIYDLQKTLSVPTLEISEVYYKRKLSMFNFTIYNVIDHQGYCYTWNESEAKKGANEIATCVLLFIEMVASRGVKEIIFWSDNCSGQNKNKYLFSMYTFACAKYNIKISHRYMEKGHTMNEADSMHARIERAAKFKSIYEPFDWIDIIKNCKVNGNQYVLTSVGEKILNFHPLAEKYQKWNDPSAKWRFVREIIIDSEVPGKVKVRHDLSSNEQVEIKTTCKVGRPLNLSRFEFKRAFDSPLKLDKNKLKDLAALCNDLVIPVNKHDFYLKLVDFPDLSNPLAFIEESDAEEILEEEQNDDAVDFQWENKSENDESDYEEELQNLQRAKAQRGNKSSGEESKDVRQRNARRATARQEVSFSSSEEGESENESEKVDDLDDNEHDSELDASDADSDY